MGHSHSEDSRLHVLIHAKNHGYVRGVKYDMQAGEIKQGRRVSDNLEGGKVHVCNLSFNLVLELK